MPPKDIGQGRLEIPAEELSQVEFDPDANWGASRVIKFMAEQRNLDPSLITSRDMNHLTPSYVESGLYVPDGMKDIDIDLAKGPVIFPPEEYKLLTKSPLHIGKTAAAGVFNARKQETDKLDVSAAAKRASAHSLESMLSRTNGLLDGLRDKEEGLKVVSVELSTARNTGLYAFEVAGDLIEHIEHAEQAIFDALEVTAIAKNWTDEQYERAKRTLEFQLFGLHDERFKNWKSYVPMVRAYTRQRRLVVMSSHQALEKELRKYKQESSDE